MLKRIKKSFLTSTGLLFLCSCSTMETSVTQTDIDEVDKLAPPPSQNITRYEDSLHLLGEMLDAYNAPFINVQTKNITNDTASRKVPENLSQMVITAINKIGPQVAYIDFDANRLLTEQALGRKITIEDKLPDVVIRGAITEFDKDMIKKNRNIEADVLAKYHGKEIDAGGELDSDAAGSRVGIDMQVVNYETKRLISGVQTSNRLNLYKTSNTKELGVAFEGNGLGFKCSVKKQQGLHSSLRLIIEMSILELLGKYYDVPYWRCLPDGKPNKRMIKLFKRNLPDDPAIALKLKVLAYGHGKDVNLTTDAFTPQDVVLLDELKAKYNPVDDFDLYYKLWESLPIKTAATRMRTARKQLAQAATQQQVQQVETVQEVATQQVEAVQEVTTQQVNHTVNATKNTVNSSVTVESSPNVEVTIPLNNNSKGATNKPLGFGRISEDDF